MRCVAVLLLAQALLAPATLEEKIDAVLESSPAGARRAFWGIQIADAASGEVLYQKDADRFFVPASNTKLFSTALALVRLGPDHRFETTVNARQAPDASGRLRGDLLLIGGGDPTLSAREVPYKKGPIKGDPLQAIKELADQLVADGLLRIDGDVVGDDTAYVWEPYPEGWSQDDALWEYGAPVSALTVNDNSLSVTVRPATRAGDPARLFFSPSLNYLLVENRIITTAGGERKIHVRRNPGSRRLYLWGAIPSKDRGITQLVAVDDPALFAASALLDALTRRGVSISGQAVARHRFPNEAPDLKSGGDRAASRPPVELARRTSPPLVETLRILNKVSQNLHAEIVLREVGRVKRNIGSREAGLEELQTFLAEAGIEKGECKLRDASGLSRLNLITPAAVTKLLIFMYRSEHREAWLSLLPVGGEDGTLSERFAGKPDGRRILAKTGTVSHVSALSGYARREKGDLLAFSILVNNYNAQASEVRRVIDKICIVMIE